MIMPSSKGVINIDFDVDNIATNQIYWIVIEDLNADKNNYHRFKLNGNPMGTLIKDKTVTNKESLCFSVYSSDNKQSYYSLPQEWTIIPSIDEDDEEESNPTIYDEQNDIPKGNSMEYKMTNTFYRYNTNQNSNIYLSNIIIKNGYYYEDEVEENASENKD